MSMRRSISRHSGSHSAALRLSFSQGVTSGLLFLSPEPVWSSFCWGQTCSVGVEDSGACWASQARDIKLILLKTSKSSYFHSHSAFSDTSYSKAFWSSLLSDFYPCRSWFQSPLSLTFQNDHFSFCAVVSTSILLLDLVFAPFYIFLGFPGGASDKESTCQCRRYEMWVQSLRQEDPLEEEMAPYSSILTCWIPRTEEPGRLQSMGLQSGTWMRIWGTKKYISGFK